MTKSGGAAIVARMHFVWFILGALGAAIVFYWLAVGILFVIGLATDRREIGSVRFVSGETIVVPPEPAPERPRKRWRIKIERV